MWWAGFNWLGIHFSEASVLQQDYFEQPHHRQLLTFLRWFDVFCRT